MPIRVIPPVCHKPFRRRHICQQGSSARKVADLASGHEEFQRLPLGLCPMARVGQCRKFANLQFANLHLPMVCIFTRFRFAHSRGAYMVQAISGGDRP